MKAWRCAALAALVFWLALPARAADITHELSARLGTSEVVRGRFEQSKTVAGFSRPLVSQGDFLLWRDRGLLWLTRAPFPAQLALTRNQLSASAGAGAARQQIDTAREPAMKAVNQLFLALMAGDVAALRERFTVKGELIGKTGWRIELAPTEAGLRQHLKRIEMAGDRHVRRVRLDEANGDTTAIGFSALTESPPPTADEARQLGL